MPPVYASVDIETTGLHAERDSIIEIGIVLFQGDRFIDQWSSLINPGRRVPPAITDLTGITQLDVDGAPSLNAVRARVEEMARDRILVAHNASFDMAFLNQNRLCRANQVLDTLELASILFPTAGHYSLSVLAESLELDDFDGKQAHRALADARITARLFQRLQKEALSLSYTTLEEIVSAGRRSNWPAFHFFEQALAVITRTAFVKSPDRKAHRVLFSPPHSEKKEKRIAVGSRESMEPIEIDQIGASLGRNGSFAKSFENFEYRAQQIEMAKAISEAFNHGTHLMVEAGTGTGKSIAYLLPAIHWAVNNNERVIISTNTINLQDQLLTKDIPELERILEFPFQVAVLKGRNNYICPRLFNGLRRSGPSTVDEMRVLARILVWLPLSNRGERDEISLRTFGEQIVWSKLNAENEGCTAESCAYFLNGCPLYHARRRAEVAHILIVNHALLLSDIVTGQRVLPGYRYLIVDEAHHLENATTNGLSFEADQRTLERLISELTHRRGFVMELMGRCRAALPPEYLDPVTDRLLALQHDASTTGTEVGGFFRELGNFMEEHAGSGERRYSARALITSGLRIQPNWEQVEIAWEDVSQRLSSIIDGLKWTRRALDEIMQEVEIADVEDLLMRAKSLQRDTEQVKQNIDGLIFNPSEEMIYWAELAARRNHVGLHAAPLHVGPLVEEHLFHQKENVILTSATLQTMSPSSDGRNGFDYIRERLNAWDSDELSVGSPFDYLSSTLFFLPTDMPEPRQPGYQRLIDSSLISLCRSLQGRTLILFTSYAQLNQTANAIRGALSDSGIALLQQGGGISRQQMVARFRNAPSSGRGAVLLGTRSFWEGVDVPGPALSCVVIVKLPFDVPSDPIFAARQKSFENSFYEYAVPEAVLRFRQGFGRLIRSKEDRGVVVCLDKRLLTKQYGRFFLESLPECTVRRDKIALLSKAAASWVNKAR